MNKQRETIYAERDKVLRNEDLSDTIRSFVDDEMDHLVDQYCQGSIPDEWDMEALSHALHAMGLDGPGTSADDLWDAGGREALLGHLRELADGKLDARGEETGEVDWAMVERLVLLRTIDSLWIEHLTELDDMRRGIGLRGYAQQDPLNEFKKEGYALYEELRDLIRRQVATTIFRVTVVKEEPQPMPMPDFSGGLPAGDGEIAAAAASFGGETGGAAATGTFGGATVTGSGGVSRSGARGACTSPSRGACRARPR